MQPLRLEIRSSINKINVLSPLLVETRPANVLVRRLDAHLKACATRTRGRCFATASKRCIAPTTESSSPEAPIPPIALLDLPLSSSIANRQDHENGISSQLPCSCPGCGALTQESKPASAGYYTRSRRIVKQYLQQEKNVRIAAALADVENDQEVPKEDAVTSKQDSLQADKERPPGDAEHLLKLPFCDRCHDLLHNSRGNSIVHPSVDSIADSIAESPFRRNHIYHVIDAADFPMSLVPDVLTKLTVAKQRSQNRRSQHDFSSRPTLSFIITRSDLLGQTKEVVDKMMTYFQSVLRQALGRTGRDMRLGNVHLISAKRGWWTREIKEEIWERGGGNWLVGKANVGKSNLFEVLFPKGSGKRAPIYAELQDAQEKESRHRGMEDLKPVEDLFQEDRLLPPAQPESPFPVLPIVSSLPGTTASPIRLPFGNRKGELVDLPGLARSDLENYVKAENRVDLVMTHRHKVEQHIIKAGQSLILGGGLIRITPQLDPEDRSTTILAYPFVPLKAHVTSTVKATGQQTQQRESGIESILAEDVGKHMASAGTFDLSSDVTKSRSGPLLRSGMELSKLPFCVYATDVLVEGIGWIELVCQVRRRTVSQPALAIVAPSDQLMAGADPQYDNSTTTSDSGFAPFTVDTPMQQATTSRFPRVEIFSPGGQHVSQRPSLEAWTRWTDGRKQKDSSMRVRRPRT